MHMDKIMILTTSKFERLVKNRVAQEMMVQNVSLEKDLAQKQADITYLQNQINPHFLYNTLECIRGQALNEGMDDLADTVKALALFFRYNISVKGTVVSFEEELKNLENYISIQQYRFKNKFTMHVDIEPEEKKQILACRLPKLCLQPLVENAVCHGICQKMEGGTVQIRSFRKNGEICVQILDDGAGFDTEKLKDADGIAIRNLKLRLKEFLNADLEIESRKGEGCRQTIHIPWEETEDENYSDR